MAFDTISLPVVPRPQLALGVPSIRYTRASGSREQGDDRIPGLRIAEIGPVRIRKGLPAVYLYIRDHRRKEPPTDITQKVVQVVNVEPGGREVRRERLLPGEAVQGVDLVKEGSLRTNRDEEGDLGQRLLDEEIDTGNAP